MTRTRRFLSILACLFPLTADLHAQCPDGTPPPCGPRRVRSVGDRLGLAIFPFRATTTDASDWSEALPDLLSTALDGTPGVRISDPWALWRPLRADRHAPAESPDPVEAARLARDAGAHNFILGSVAHVGGRLNLAVRIYRSDRKAPLFTFAADRSADSVAALIDDVQLEVLARLAGPERRRAAGIVEHSGTHSPQALREYLAAREALRRGRLAAAEAAIDRALALDSTFALALVEATHIKSWAQSAAGRTFTGLMPFAERAVRYGDSLNERQRLRARATLASVRTEGARCAESAARIIEIDSTDIEGWIQLAYCTRAYGWQFGRGEREAARAAERAVQLDPNFVPGVVMRAELAFYHVPRDAADVQRQLQRLRRVDTTNTVARSAVRGTQAVLAGDRAFPGIATAVARGPVAEWIAVFRHLRATRPDRAERLIDETRRASNPTIPANLVLGAEASLLVAEGRAAQVDSTRMAQLAADTTGLGSRIDLLLVAAAVSGVWDAGAASAAVARLTRYVPVDSAEAYFMRRPVWQAGWALAAYHAQLGDTAVTRLWREALSPLGRVPGSTVPDWVAALQADLDSRLAERRGDKATALTQAGRALALWAIHTDNIAESEPEPAMRFHLAMLLSDTGHRDSAEVLLRSLAPPASVWMGFYTPRASAELAELTAARGDAAEAAARLRAALAFWERGGTEVSRWRDRAAASLARVTAGGQ